LSTPAAPGPGLPVCAGSAPPLAPRALAEAEAPAAGDAARFRYRARFRKTGRIRFLGHLDLSRALMRALRRAGVAFAYSQGFNPKPRVAFGPALSVGIGSEGEYVDFDTIRPVELETIVAQINATLPQGIEFDVVREIRADLPALTAVARAARYRVHTGGDVDPAAAVAQFHERGPVVIERKKDGKVRSIAVEGELIELLATGGDALRMTLSVSTNGASLRPDEVLHELFGDRAATMRTIREDILVDWNGRLVNPMLAVQAGM
jgi:radical SAM-linked protein